MSTARSTIENSFIKALGYSIRRRAKELGYTLRRVAFISGVSYKTIERYAFGEKIPRLEVMFAIAAALKCTVDDLVPKAPMSEVPRRKKVTVSSMGRVVKHGTCRRTMFYRKAAERGFTYPDRRQVLIEWNAKQRALKEQQRAKKIRTRAELVREKTRAVQKNASAA